jgi:hypothetical protein
VKCYNKMSNVKWKKQQPALSFFSFIYTVEQCSTSKSRAKIPQKISKKLIDTRHLNVYTGTNYTLA